MNSQIRTPRPPLSPHYEIEIDSILIHASDSFKTNRIESELIAYIDYDLHFSNLN